MGKPAAKRTNIELITLPDDDERVAFRESLFPAKKPRTTEEPPPDKQICKRFLAGSCDLGDTCKFVHDPSYFQQPCKHFLAGKCKRGADCQFIHPPAEKEAAGQGAETSAA